MKTVVVVVGNPQNDRIIFEGEDLKLIDTSQQVSSLSQSPKLIIRDKQDGKEVTIAVFAHWLYWKEYKAIDEDRKEDEDDAYEPDVHAEDRFLLGKKNDNPEWEADVEQILSITESLKKAKDRKQALKGLAKAKKLIEKIEKKYDY